MDNLRGAALMTLAMLGFAVEDMCIKLMSDTLPTWQIVLFLALGGAASFAAILRARGMVLVPRAAFVWPVHLRNLFEAAGTMGFVTALALSPLSTVSAILQSAPLFVTLGAALFLGEAVGWRRWSAIFVGFAGVLLILRPGSAGFDPNALFALIGVLGLSMRDLATRRVPSSVSSLQVALLAFLTLVPTAGLLALFSDQRAVLPGPEHWGLIAASVAFGVISYWGIVAAMRAGDVAFVTPFRYSRMIFALVIGLTVFGERPDALMLGGAAIIIASGLFTLWRERIGRASARAAATASRGRKVL